MVSTSTEVVLLTSKMYDLEEVRSKTRPGLGELLRMLRTEAKLSEERIGAKRDSALSRYFGVLRSVGGIIKAVEECSASRVYTWTQLRLMFEERGN